MGLDRDAARTVGDEIDLVSFLLSGEHRLCKADLGHQASHDQLLATRRIDRGPELRVRPGMGRGAVDRRDVGKNLGNFLEQGVDEDAALRSDSREDGRDADVPGCLGEARDIVDHQAGIDRVNH